MAYKKIEDAITYRKAYYTKNREKIRCKAREKRIANIETYKLKEREYYAKYYYGNLESVRERNRKWKATHRSTTRVYQRNRRASNPNVRIIDNVRRRVNQALHGIKKLGHTKDLLGCTIEGLRAHLEQQFQPGMTWDNYGHKGWNIDHKVPCAMFDLTNPEDQKKCFHYTNLQPLWAKDNWSKGARYVG